MHSKPMWQFASFQVQVVLFVCTIPVESLQLKQFLSLAQHDLALRSKENTERIIICVAAAMSSGLGAHGRP